MSEARKTLGSRGEEAICAFMERQGFEVVTRNWRCSYGEIDIIARQNGVLIFCEVKTRKSMEAGTPDESITWRKQERYTRMAKLYLKREHPHYEHLRFDVATVSVY
ncbi:MAG: YraN family protein, partial [Actinomycetes bacterium]|nr:YraN family protein [Actinomycetes bacterium]